ncbi:MAG TPA: hypothetical protein DF774_10330 [Rheinheimera sp.]|nr:hypothetical protein [Rheinheimera sp.]
MIQKIWLLCFIKLLKYNIIISLWDIVDLHLDLQNLKFQTAFLGFIGGLPVLFARLMHFLNGSIVFIKIYLLRN